MINKLKRQNNHKRRNQYHLGNGLLSITGIAVLAATIFTMWTPANLFSDRMQNIYEIWQAQEAYSIDAAPTPTHSSPARIGIVSGHYANDSGAVCDDGWTEAEANLTIASMVAQKLKARNYTVDLLEEFDPQLDQYKGLVLVSIHNDSCQYINEEATGFKVVAQSVYQDRAERLEKCMIHRYQTVTNMKFHVNSVTDDMTSYHTFNEIHTDTTAAIIETGFMKLDEDMLRNHPEIVADGIVAGIECFLHKENVPENYLQDTP